MLLVEAEPPEEESEADGEAVAAPDAEPSEALPDVVVIVAVVHAEEAEAADEAAMELDMATLDEEARALTEVWIRISWHCAPMYSS